MKGGPGPCYSCLHLGCAKGRFEMVHPCLVINLERRPDRRERFLRLNGGKAEFRFLPAVEGTALDPGKLKAGGLLAPDALAITPGGVGCALSHRRAWQECVESGRSLIVLEDDAVLAPGFARMADQALAGAPGSAIIWTSRWCWAWPAG